MARRMASCRWYFRHPTCLIYLVIVGVLLIFIYAYFLSGPRSIFSDQSNEVDREKSISVNSAEERREDQSVHQRVNVAAPSVGNKSKTSAADARNPSGGGGDTVSFINVMLTFTNAAGNPKLQEKFRLCVSSLLEHASVPLSFYVIGDTDSQNIAEEILKEKTRKAVYKMVRLDVDDLAKNLHEVVSRMQKHFSYKPGSYYSHALFFLSIAIHRVMPESMGKVIMLDADLKFLSDIAKLYALFSDFKEDNVIGIARENQPVYHHLLWQHRKENPGSRAGRPPPDGLTGFNSGVLLLDLDRMRQSKLYNLLLSAEAVTNLTQTYHFQGHLGDQDFFSLLSFAHEELFYVLPCGWNRQLCQWWKNKGYDDIYDQYFHCEGPVHILHGNCDTPIP